MKFLKTSKALNGGLRVYKGKTGNKANPSNALSDAAKSIRRVVRKNIGKSGLKFQLYMHIVLEKDLDEERTMDADFSTKQKTALRGSNIRQLVNQSAEEMLAKIDEFVKMGSGWKFQRLVKFHLKIAKYQPFRAGCNAQLPRWIANKKAVVNIRCEHDYCFAWTVARGITGDIATKKRQLIFNRLMPIVEQLNWDGICFPAELSDVSKFESQNDISISVLGYDAENVFFPLYLTRTKKDKHVNLLYHDEHFSLISGLNRLLFQQTKNRNPKFFCPKCLHKFTCEMDLDEHGSMCAHDTWQMVEMPTDKELCFTNFGRILMEPRVVYADMECILRPISGCSQSPEKPSTKKAAEHVPCGASFVEIFQCCKRQEPVMGKQFLHRGKDCVKQFLSALTKLASQHAKQVADRNRKCKKTPQDAAHFVAQTVCHICQKHLKKDSVFDHCHFCGRYRGAAHSDCNIANQARRELTVVFHNLRKYDGHLILQRVGQLAIEQDLEFDCIPKGMADYLCFSIRCDDWKIRFIDSYQFLASSLATLADNLDRSSFRAMKQMCPDNHLRTLLLRKGVYPYEYMDSFRRFQETTLPQIQNFHSKLTGLGISESDYDHAKTVFREFRLKNLGAYHDLYLKTDVLLLADIFQNFRNFAREHYNLEPLRYITLPSYGWDALLLTSDVTLELLQDEEMYMFFERGMRGGISTITRRYARANNPHVGGYDPKEPKSYIIYLDANNLYGWTMTQHLPVGEFAWAYPTVEEVLNLPDDSDYGYILEADISYAWHLHDEHNDYPLASEKIKITEDMLSPFCESFEKEKGSIEKLTPNLNDKNNYIIHYRNLKQCDRLGLDVINIKRAVRFRQKPWMRSYIQKNTALRSKATSDFEKDLFKLLNNAVFGKSMENVRKYADVKLVSTEEKMFKLAKNGRFEAFQIFHSNLAAIKMVRGKVKLCKPIYTGFVVLDLSKMLMTDFHYDYVRTAYGDDAKLLFTDTDSLCYWIKTDNVYRDMLKNSQIYDTSNYPENHFLFSNNNKKVMGKMKDETAGVPIEEFVGLRPKMYSIKYGLKQKATAKGVTKSVKKTLEHQAYLKILQESGVKRDQMQMIRNVGHELFTVSVNKISLSAYDNKRYILSDGISSLAYGHYKI